jgi:predicted DCC family thiol-disulfide oxidoreductase YuxK
VYADPGTFVVYDGECPFCTQYVKLVRLREAVGPVTLINAREDHPAVRYLQSQGVDLNEEMALIMNGTHFTGPECMHRLSLMSTDAGFFNALTARIFSNRRTAKTLYPVLRAGRNLTLRLLGRRPIGGRDR